MKQTINVKINAWIICIILLVLNLITIGFWQPWNSQSVSGRKIVVTGTTTIKAEADQFTFNPYYQVENSDKTAANTELSNKSNAIIAKLKELGVADSAIKTDVNSYKYSIYYGPSSGNETSTLYLTVIINDKTLAQKVEDYISTTSPSGSITPQISFSTAKSKTLEATARQQAIDDAKTKAEASAKQLGANIGRVISVTDSNNGGGIYPMYATTGNAASDSVKESSSTSYTIQPGQNDYTFSVEVTYEIK